MADLSAATLDDVKNFFRTYYAPNNATLVIAGDFAPDSAKAWVRQYFGGIPHGPPIPARPNPARVTLARDTMLVLEDKVQLPRFYYTWPTVRLFTSDDAPLEILADVLAGDKNRACTSGSSMTADRPGRGRVPGRQPTGGRVHPPRDSQAGAGADGAGGRGGRGDRARGARGSDRA